jgi:hypothetical protein
VAFPAAVVVGALVVVAGTVVVVTAVVVVAASASVVDVVESLLSLDELQPAATSAKAMDAPKINRAFTRTLPDLDESRFATLQGHKGMGSSQSGDPINTKRRSAPVEASLTNRIALSPTRLPIAGNTSQSKVAEAFTESAIA